MEFGKVQYIDNIDFTLPPDDPVTLRMWERRSGASKQPLRVRVGGTEWGRTSWLGRVYPKGTKSTNFLPFYAKQFSTVEGNTLYYGLQPPATIERWASMTGDDFRFCPKFLETISHKQQLVDAAADTGAFIESVRHFGPRLGPAFLQLSEGFGPDRAPVLMNYVRGLPRDFRAHVELRHPAWFGSAAADRFGSSEEPVTATFELFRELGIGTVITDVAGRRDVLHMRLTAPVAFIRFVSNGLHRLDYSRVDAWAERLAAWAVKGLEEVYFFVHSPQEQTSPEMMAYVIGKFNERLGAGLPVPNLANGGQAETLSLF
ncbi:MAG TPA: DUF72 domain-containing protein [Puia sp.]|uniref:DUF72 domain-containing protein n=1 Tax=Puia sp. TaxID=2045100 RepID=UPI002C22404D|nr:DUF72 domain-containing protein [Puia sp.]HVU96737.1 DUF72 domain-containing protein [Puia sp.]